jgi:ParB family chromosome partitioning protein
MKANAPKRKVFNDAVDLLTAGAPEAGVQMIGIDDITPFHEHPFRLYEGERLDDMVESVREHGILSPVIVQKTKSGYEMLAGHNRQNAARIAGLKEIPAIVKENLSEAEAWVYVVETNVMQRAFSDLSISERITVLAARYDKVCGTKKREEILEELQRISGDGGHHVHQQAKSRELLGQEYGMTGRNVARYIRCNQLIQAFKEMLDDGTMTLVVGVELSHLSAEEQEVVRNVMERNCIKLKGDVAGKLRAASGSITEAGVEELFGVDKPVDVAQDPKPVSVKIPAGVYSRYFSNVAAKDVQGILEAALEQYFTKKGA